MWRRLKEVHLQAVTSRGGIPGVCLWWADLKERIKILCSSSLQGQHQCNLISLFASGDPSQCACSLSAVHSGSPSTWKQVPKHQEDKRVHGFPCVLCPHVRDQDALVRTWLQRTRCWSCPLHDTPSFPAGSRQWSEGSRYPWLCWRAAMPFTKSDGAMTFTSNEYDVICKNRFVPKTKVLSAIGPWSMQLHTHKYCILCDFKNKVWFPSDFW